MALPPQIPIKRHTGNGVTTVFAYDFKVSKASDMRVTVDGVVKTLNVDYTVSGVGNTGGGNVTFTTAPTGAVVLKRAKPYGRDTTYQNDGDLLAETVNADYDNAIEQIQQLAEEVSRGVQVPETEPGGNWTLPALPDRASKFLAFDAQGRPIPAAGIPDVPVTPYIATLATAATAEEARVKLGAPSSDAVVYSDDLSSPASGKGVDLVARAVAEDKDAIFKAGLFPYTSSPVHFYGDSITVGVGASDPSKSYVSLLCARLGWTPVNYAISGGSIMDWIANATGQDVADDAISVILPGFNDQRHVGTATPSQRAYEYALAAAAAMLAIPESRKIRGNDSRISYTGTWANTPIYRDGKFSTSVGDSASVRVSGDTVYICTIQQHLAGGRMRVEVDGVDHGVWNLNQPVANGGAVSALTYMPMLVRIPGLGDGVHDVEITVETKDDTSGSNAVYIEWVAGSGAVADTNARVLIGSTLRMNSTGAGQDGPNYDNYTDAVNRAFVQMAARVCGELAADGLQVRYVNTNAVYDPDSADVDADNVHPSDIGFAKIAGAFIAALDARQSLGVPTAAQRQRTAVQIDGAAYLANGWGNVGSEFMPLTFIKSPDGRVSINGVISAGTKTDDTIVFSLPEGFRPAASEIAVVAGETGFARLLIDAGGNARVFNVPAESNYISFASVSFTAAQQ